jgi:hypothetical protein
MITAGGHDFSRVLKQQKKIQAPQGPRTLAPEPPNQSQTSEADLAIQLFANGREGFTGAREKAVADLRQRLPRLAVA